MTDLSVTIKKTIRAPREKVFDAWLDPETLAKFMLPMKGMPEPKVVNDPRVGGTFTITMFVGDDSLPHKGEYLKIERPSTLVFSWVSDHSIEGSIVTLDFIDLEGSTTEVVLTQVKFYDDGAMQDHKRGWTSILETLDDYLS